MDIIRMNNLIFYGYHGVSETEKDLGGKFEVDLELYRSLQAPGRSDKLDDTIDYESVYKSVESCIKAHKHYLIESLAEDISKAVLKDFPVEKIIVCVRKPNAPVSGVLDSVEVEIERHRSDYD